MRTLSKLTSRRQLAAGSLPCRNFSTSLSVFAHRKPYFTTEEDGFKTFAHTPAFHIHSSLILYGTHDIKLSSQTFGDLDGEQFGDGSRLAVSAVTQELAEGNLEALKESVTPRCFANIKRELEASRDDPDNLKAMAIQNGDIFFSWIASTKAAETGKAVMVGTFSFPRGGELAEIISERKAKIKAYVDELKRTKEENPTAKLRDFISTMEADNPEDMFQDNDFVVGNFALTRSPEGQWLVDSVRMRNAKDVFSTLFYYRWKGRYGLSIKTGYKFKSVLRWDWTTDFILWTLVITFILNGSF